MWLLVAALLLGLWFGRTVKDVLSAVFLTCVSVSGLYWLITEAPDAWSLTPIGRRVAEILATDTHASLTGLILISVPMVLFSAAISRQPDRLKHWDEFGPQKRRGRRAHA
jgi:hypothetical protein